MPATLLLLPILHGAIYYLVGASEDTRPAEDEARAAAAGSTTTNTEEVRPDGCAFPYYRFGEVPPYRY